MFSTIKFIYPHWRAHARRMVAIVVLGLLSAALHTVTPLIIKHIIDGLKTHLSPEYITKDILIILGAGVLIYIVNLFAQRNRAWMNMRIEWEIRKRVFDHILSLDSRFYHAWATGDLVTRLLDDIEEKLSWFACSGVFRFIQSSFTFIIVISVMFYMNVPLTLWSLIPMPFLLLLYIRTGRLMTLRYNEVQKAISGIIAFLEACFTGIRVVKANSKEKCQSAAFIKMAFGQRDAEIAATKLHGLFSSVFHYAGFMCVFFVFLGGGKMVMAQAITLGELIAFQFFTAMIVWPLFDISNFVVSGKRASVSVERLKALLKTRAGVTDTAVPLEIGGRITSLGFNSVSFKPGSRGEPEVLKNITFSAQSGKRMAVVGKIGSGKSLLMSLVPRLADASSGTVVVDGIDIRSLKIAELRSKVGYVPQEAVIFTDTIKNNITLGRKHLDQKQIDQAVEASQLKNDLESFPKGLDAAVGTRGTTLSGGQKQRIAVARAIIGKPDILLLDDCTSAMDADTENNLWEALSSYMPESICMIITHRAKTIANSDHILTIENGRLVEEGRHEELLKLQGVYAQIYQRQKLEDELGDVR